MQMNFRTSDQNGTQLELFDALGRCVQILTVKDAETVLLTKNLAPGNFVLKATTGTGTESINLIKLP